MNTIEEYKTELEFLKQSIKELKEKYKEERKTAQYHLNHSNLLYPIEERQRVAVLHTVIDDLEELLK